MHRTLVVVDTASGRYLADGLLLTDSPTEAIRFAHATEVDAFVSRFACEPSRLAVETSVVAAAS